MQEYDPSDFLLTSFTRAAAVELAGRIDVPRRSVGTLHSVCYNGLGRPPIAEAGTLSKEWNASGIPPAWRIGAPMASLEDGLTDSEVGTMMSMYSPARSACLPAPRRASPLGTDTPVCQGLGRVQARHREL